jgi:hypothetical protein
MQLSPGVEGALGNDSIAMNYEAGQRLCVNAKLIPFS